GSSRGGRANSDSAQMFEDLRQELTMAFEDIQAAQKEAKSLFEETRDQGGLSFVCRMMLTKATSESRGQLYKKTDDFLRECFKMVASVGLSPADELLLCRIDLIANWQLKQAKGPIFWQQFE